MSKKRYAHTSKYFRDVMVKHRREKKNISLETLANQINLDPNNLGRIERGEQIPEFITAIKIIHALDIDANEFTEKAIEQMMKDEYGK